MIKKLFFLSISFFLPLSALASGICYQVSGAGTASANGTYTSTGQTVLLTFNSCSPDTIDKYTNGTLFIVPSNGGQISRICPTSSGCASGSAYYSSGTDILCSPNSTYAGTWSTTNPQGIAPAPLVTQISCPSTAPNFFLPSVYIPSVFSLSFTQTGTIVAGVLITVIATIIALMGLGYGIRKLRMYISGKKF